MFGLDFLALTLGWSIASCDLLRSRAPDMACGALGIGFADLVSCGVGGGQLSLMLSLQ